MIRLDNMLMIGSSASNVGKTELACALLRRLAGTHPITAVKVTAVRSRERSCPRGGAGCGVCSSLEAPYQLTEETRRDSAKDTARLLAAGADRVYWLRVLYAHLRQGLAALLETTGSDTALLCESNSLRQVVEPGLFLVVADAAGRPWKRSAREVREYADATVRFDAGRFDLDLDRIRVADRRWLLTEDAAAIVLAGGRSRRMGTDKSLLTLAGRPMIEYICRQLRGTFARVLISANDTRKFSFLGLEVVPDEVPDQGPLRAIASALEVSDREFNLVVGCDIPRINLPVVRRVLAAAVGADIVLPVTPDGREQPLFAVYRRDVRLCMREALAAGERRLSAVYDRCQVQRLALADASWFANLNTRSDYERFREGADV